MAFVIANLFSALFDLLGLLARSEHEKDVEILLLRQQLRIMQRIRTRPPRLSWWEKLPLTILAAQLIQGATHAHARLSQSLLLFSPATVLRWHRELVRRKWTFPYRRAAGRPRIAAELEALIVRLAKENPRWGYSKIEGEFSSWATALGVYHSSRAQTPAYPCLTLACPAKQQLARLSAPTSAPTAGL